MTLGGDQRRLNVLLAALGVGGLLLRVVATIASNQHVPLGIGDGNFYDGAANLLADGHGYHEPLLFAIGDDRPTALHPPLWPTLLAVPSFFGLDSQLTHRLVGCIVGAALVPLAGLLAHAVLRDARVAITTAAIVAVHPTLLAADGSLHAETLAVVLATAMLVAVSGPRTSWRLVSIGVLGGLTTLTRGEGLVLTALVVVGLLVTADSGERLKPALLVIGGAAIVVVPWTVRNVVQLDAFVPVSTNDSTVLAGANCDFTYFGPGIGTWKLDCIAARPPDVSEAEQAAEWRADGVAYALDHPTRLPVVAGARVARVWGLWFPLGQEQLEGRSHGLNGLGSWVHTLAVLPLAVAGATVLAQRRERDAWILLVPPAVVTITALGAFGTLRFRHTAEPVLAILVATALVAALDDVRARRRLRVA